MEKLRKKNILFLEHHISHEDIPTLIYLYQKNIRTIFIPSYTTHKLQPEDDLIFANLKSLATRKIYEKLQSSILSNTPLKGVIQSCMPEAIREALTSDVIVKSFQNTGLVPFSPNIIKNRLCSEDFSSIVLTQKNPNSIHSWKILNKSLNLVFQNQLKLKE
jgi:hypothetical protein